MSNTFGLIKKILFIPVIGSLLFSFSFLGRATEEPEVSLWEEFSTLDEHLVGQDIDYIVNMRMNSIIKGEDMDFVVGGTVKIEKDTNNTAIAEEISVNMQGDIANMKNISFSAGGEIRLFTDAAYFLMSTLKSKNIEELEDTDPFLAMFQNKWFQLPEEIAASMTTDLFNNTQIMSAEQLAKQIVTDLQKVGKEDMAIVLEEVFEAFREGKVFTLHKRNISPEKDMYVLRLNKRGILAFLKQQMGSQEMSEEFGEMLLEAQHFLQKISFSIIVEANPQTNESEAIYINIKGRNVFPEIDLFMLRLHLTSQLDVSVNVQKPKNAEEFPVDL